MSSQKVHVEHCQGVNGLDKVILREIRGCSAEVFPSLSFAFSYPIILVSVFGNGNVSRIVKITVSLKSFA